MKSAKFSIGQYGGSRSRNGSYSREGIYRAWKPFWNRQWLFRRTKSLACSSLTPGTITTTRSNGARKRRQSSTVTSVPEDAKKFPTQNETGFFCVCTVRFCLGTRSRRPTSTPGGSCATVGTTWSWPATNGPGRPKTGDVLSLALAMTPPSLCQQRKKPTGWHG